jgi:methyl-accepting chemotaxis protein
MKRGQAGLGRWFADLSVAKKLYGGFGAVLALLAVIAGVALWGSSAQGSAAHTLSTKLRLTQEAMQVKFRGADFNGWQTAYAFDIIRRLKGAASDSASSRSAFLKSAASFRQELATVAQESLSPPERQAVQTARSAFDQFMSTDVQVIALYRKGDHSSQPQANSLVLGREISLFTTISGAIDSLVRSVRADSHRASAQASSAQSTATTLTLIAAIIALLVAGALAFTITRALKRGVARVLDRIRSLAEHDTPQLEQALGAMADGDLTTAAESETLPIRDPYDDEIGRIAQGVNSIVAGLRSAIDAYNRTRDQLSHLIAQVAGSAGQVSAASQQIAATSDEAGRATGEIAQAVSGIAQGAERQVHVVEGARRTAEEVSRAVGEAAENAACTSEMADEARQIAQQGVGAAGQAQDAMQSVRESSQAVTDAIRELAAKSDQIGAIVNTITGISEQTNLLALNAAIEAARAGEQGRGFAVVAEEVRKLAEESQQAAGEIAGLIGAIQSETSKVVSVVEDGTRRTHEGAAVVEQTRDAFVRIGSSVDDMASRIEQIAAVSEEIAASAQSMQDGIGEVAAVAEQSSASTEQVSASTEETSASAQEIAASAQELSSNAEQLNHLVSKFKVTA